MPLFPEWVPNLHPLIIHFPIALLYVAALFDCIAFVAKDRGGWRISSTTLYLLGAVGAVAAYFAGMQAADSVFLPTEANALLTEHSDLGTWTMYFFSAYALLRLGLSFGRVAKPALMRGLFLVVGIGGLALLTITADHGAELVFRYGVGVQAIEDQPVEPEMPSAEDAAGNNGFVAAEGERWTWTSTRASAWKETANWIEGDGERVESVLADGAERGDVLQLSLEDGDGAIAFTFPGIFDRLQVDVALDLSEFDGTLMIIHHVQENGDLAFASIGNGVIRLGNRENGDLLVGSENPFEEGAWRDVRLVADGTHYRLYVDTELVIHGHGDAYIPGTVGLRLNGTGRARVAYMQAVNLAPSADASTSGSPEPKSPEATPDSDTGSDAAMPDSSTTAPNEPGTLDENVESAENASGKQAPDLSAPPDVEVAKADTSKAGSE